MPSSVFKAEAMLEAKQFVQGIEQPCPRGVLLAVQDVKNLSHETCFSQDTGNALIPYLFIMVHMKCDKESL